MDKAETLELIKQKMETQGDLPVFSASLNHIRRLSDDPDADIMSLAQEVLKDANLSIKLLRLANSPYFNRGFGKISVVSRAIVLLGIETVKNLSLTMKLIESFQTEHPSIDMDKLLVRAYISAGFVRDLALKIGVKDAEETYTCALLHDLGEISVAYFIPDVYNQIQERIAEDEQPQELIEIELLGATMASIGQALAESWDFSSKVTSTMDSEIPEIKGRVTNPNNLNKILAQVGTHLVESLYQTQPTHDFSALLYDLSKAIDISPQLLESSLSESFNRSCELAQNYGLAARKMIPAVVESGDEVRDKIARKLSFGISSSLPAERSNGNGHKQAEASHLSDDLDLHVLLMYIQEITTHISDSAKLNTVLFKVIEGIHVALKFKRVSLCLLNMDRSAYVARIVLGDGADNMKQFFSRPVNAKEDLFSRITLEGMDVFAANVSKSEWHSSLPQNFDQEIQSNSFIVSALKSGVRPIGFVYADTGAKGKPISSDQQTGFSQFVSQARLALNVCR